MSAHEYHAAPRRAEANGRLMVAAPDLLDGCKAALEYSNNQDKHSLRVRSINYMRQSQRRRVSNTALLFFLEKKQKKNRRILRILIRVC